MMKKKNRVIIGILLALVLVLSGIPNGIGLVQQVYAEETSGTCGDGLTWSISADGSTLTISGTGYMNDYDEGEAPWNDMRDSIMTIVIGDNVKSIGACAFSGFGNLVSVTIGSDVERIEFRAFGSCRSFPESLELPNSVTFIGDSAFSGCDKLKNIIIGKNVTTIGSDAFEYCSLKSVEIPASVETIGDLAFSDCLKLESISVESDNPNYCSEDGILYNKDKTTLIQYPSAHQGSSMTVPNSVKTIVYAAFADCDSLQSVTIPASVETIEDVYVFMGCSRLESISVVSDNPNYCSEDGILYNKDKTTLIKYPSAHQGSSMTVPDSVKTIGDFAFESCNNLTNVNIGNGVEIIDDAVFYGCEKLTNVNIGSGVETIGNYAFGDMGSNATITIDTYEGAVTKGDNWSGSATVTWLKCQVRVTANPSEGGKVTVTDDPSEGGEAKDSIVCDTGTTVTCTAKPLDGYVFDQWTENGNTITDENDKKVGPTYTFNVTEDRDLTANFREVLIADIESQMYTGGQIKPEGLQVELKGVDAALIEGKDYTLDYGKNVHVGEDAGSVKVTFIKDFIGEATKSFEITPQTLTVTLKSAKREYNGEALTAPYTITGLVEGDIAYAEVNSQTDVGVSESKVEIVRIENSDHEDATGDYEIEYKGSGTLSITKAPLTIRVFDQSYTYNGEPQGESDPVYDAPDVINSKVDVSGLKGKDKLTSIMLSGSRTLVGVYDDEIEASMARINDDDTSTANYEITYISGTLMITRMLLEITADSADKVYDGTPLTKNSYTNTKLAEKDTLESVTVTGSPANAGNWANTPSDAQIVDENNFDVTFCYNINYIDGTLDIEPAKVTVTTGSASKVYDGEALTNSEASMVGLVNGETAIVTATGSQTEVGSSPNTYSIDWGTTNAKNYTVTENLGTLTVEQAKEYTVTFKNEDGTELQSSKVKYGETPEYKGKTPEKEGTAQYTYTFAGWDKEIEAVKEDTTYTATYEAAVNEYTITFVNEDGSELQSSKVKYGETPEYKGKTPEKEGTAQYTYTFAGWDKELEAVKEDTTYTATYSSTVNKYDLTFDLGGGTLNGKTGTYTINCEYGSTINLPDAPTKEGYKFLYWKGSKYEAGASYKVEGAHTFTAEWEVVEKEPETSPKTGDSHPIILWASLLGGSLLAIVLLILAGRKKLKKNK